MHQGDPLRRTSFAWPLTVHYVQQASRSSGPSTSDGAISTVFLLGFLRLENYVVFTLVRAYRNGAPWPLLIRSPGT